MSVQVKICGINSLEAADAAARAGAEFAGLVFFAKSPRNLKLDKARALHVEVARNLFVVFPLDSGPDALAARLRSTLQAR